MENAQMPLPYKAQSFDIVNIILLVVFCLFVFGILLFALSVFNKDQRTARPKNKGDKDSAENLPLKVVGTAKVRYVKKVWGGYNARTIPPFGIFIKESEKQNTALLNHELVHWRQYQERGLLPFYLEYAYHSLVKGYDKNPMEVEARGNETSYCQQNYTDCVRTGQANTTHNPLFRR